MVMVVMVAVAVVMEAEAEVVGARTGCQTLAGVFVR
jgi:hypothetical protein